MRSDDRPLEELIAACEAAYIGDEDLHSFPDEEDVTHPSSGITFGMIRRARDDLDGLVFLKECAEARIRTLEFERSDLKDDLRDFTNDEIQTDRSMREAIKRLDDVWTTLVKKQEEARERSSEAAEECDQYGAARWRGAERAFREAAALIKTPEEKYLHGTFLMRDGKRTDTYGPL